MNLAELRSMVGSIVDYDPDVQTYKDEMSRLLNETYLDFMTSKPWTFVQETRDIDVYADKSGTGSITTVSPSVLSSAGIGFEDWMAGQQVQISGSTSNDGFYTIAKVLSATQVSLDAFTAAVIEAGITVKVRHEYIDLPEDCIDVLSIGVRRQDQSNRMTFSSLSAHTDEELALNLDQTGQPTDWVEVEPVSVVQPITAPVLASGGGGTFPDGSYSVKVTHISQNKESAPSPAGVFLSVGGPNRLDVSDLRLTGSAGSGILKRVYLKTPDSQAYWAVTNADADETDTTLANILLDGSYLARGTRLPEHDGFYKRIRLYPRQSSNLKIRVRYIQRPEVLIDDTDVPDYPASHHQYLVYAACHDIFTKHDSLNHATLYKRKAETEMLRLENRFLSSGASHWVMGQFQQEVRTYRHKTSLTHLG